jgi:hypothetical protein
MSWMSPSRNCLQNSSYNWRKLLSNFSKSV